MRRISRIVFAVLPLVAAVWLLVVAACASPTLPLPPPALPSVSPGPAAGQYALRSDHGAEPNAIVVIYTHDDSLPRDEKVTATLADPEGNWDKVIYGAPNDSVEVTQEFGTMRSGSTTFQLPDFGKLDAGADADAGPSDAGTD